MSFSSGEEMLIRCMKTIQALEDELQREKDNLILEVREKEVLERENESYLEKLHIYEYRLVAMQRLVQSEMGKGSMLYDCLKEVIEGRELPDSVFTQSSNFNSGSAAQLKKVNQANQELQFRIKLLEENSEKKDFLIKGWTESISVFESQLEKLFLENTKLASDRSQIRSAIQQVGLQLTDFR